MKRTTRMAAVMLAAIMLLSVFSGIGAATNELSEDTGQQEVIKQTEELIVEASESDAETPPEDFGTVIDPVTGEEHPIFPSVDDFIPENLDELIPVGGTAGSAQDDEAGTESKADMPEDETKHNSVCLDDFADQGVLR